MCSILLANASFAAVRDQALLPLTTLFSSTSYTTFIQRYGLTTAQVNTLFADNDIVRIFSYLKTISNSEDQFLELIDVINVKYAVRNRISNKTEIERLIDQSFSNTSSRTTTSLYISSTRTSLTTNQWANINVETNRDYRGYLSFFVQYRSLTDTSRSTVSSSSYFTAHTIFTNGYRMETSDNGRLDISEFIKFNRTGYFRLYVKDENNNEKYHQFFVEDTSSSSVSESVTSEYTYTAANCKTYRVQYTTAAVYTSPDFKEKMYFIDPSYLERYVDSKNPGTCMLRTSYPSGVGIRNISDAFHVGSNGKVYYIERDGNSYYSPQTTKKTLYGSISLLREAIDKANPLANLRPHTKVESEEKYTAKITYSKEFTLYKTDKGWMTYELPVGKYFITAQELKTYLEQNVK
jgi:hypothetical protein